MSTFNVVRIVRYISTLGLLLALASAAAGYFASLRLGAGAYAASAVAAALNWAAGSLALGVMWLSLDQSWRVQAALLAMLLRMAIPLTAIAAFSISRGSLATHGAAGLIVVLYLFGLAVETVMILRMVRVAGARSSTDGICSSPPSAS